MPSTTFVHPDVWGEVAPRPTYATGDRVVITKGFYEGRRGTVVWDEGYANLYVSVDHSGVRRSSLSRAAIRLVDPITELGDLAR